jgi:hypothetical protein
MLHYRVCVVARTPNHEEPAEATVGRNLASNREASPQEPNGNSCSEMGNLAVIWGHTRMHGSSLRGSGLTSPPISSFSMPKGSYGADALETFEMV